MSESKRKPTRLSKLSLDEIRALNIKKKTVFNYERKIVFDTWVPTATETAANIAWTRILDAFRRDDDNTL